MQIHQIGSLAGVLYFNSDYLTSLIEVEYDIRRNLLRIRAGAGLKLNIQRIGIRKIFKSHKLLHSKGSVWKRIMKSLAVIERNHTQIFAEFINVYPMADSTIRLRFAMDRFTNGSFTPLKANIWALLKDSAHEIIRLFHSGR